MSKIIYLIGASGSGKDSILSGLREYLSTTIQLDSDQLDYDQLDYDQLDYDQLDYDQLDYDQLSSYQLGMAHKRARPALMIAHRYICRDWKSGNENHIELSEMEFRQRQKLGLFALDWEANGLSYGIGREIDLWRAQGQHVLVNGSRGYLPTAMDLYKENLAPVLIKVDNDILRQRLISRGRESMIDIEARIARTERQFSEKETDAKNTDAKTLFTHCHVIHNNAHINDTVQQLMAYILSLKTNQ